MTRSLSLSDTYYASTAKKISGSPGLGWPLDGGNCSGAGSSSPPDHQQKYTNRNPSTSSLSGSKLIFRIQVRPLLFTGNCYPMLRTSSLVQEELSYVKSSSLCVYVSLKVVYLKFLKYLRTKYIFFLSGGLRISLIRIRIGPEII